MEMAGSMAWGGEANASTFFSTIKSFSPLWIHLEIITHKCLQKEQYILLIALEELKK